MCGICGFIDFKPSLENEVLNNMVSTLHHRGPNDRGSDVFSYNIAAVGFGHTRLSILDLSPAGHQPMHFEHLSIVFNGEIYNFNEIKKELSVLGHRFQSESDTEVILHSFAEWGTNCVSKFIGMFAFAILNKATLELFLIRDRAGIKPLYFYWNEGLLLFSSELKAFHQHPHFTKKINENAVHQYMDFGYVPSPYCIFENCHKLNPGHILTFNIEKASYSISKYWDVNDFYRLSRLNISYDEAKEDLEKLLLSAFEYRMVSDVPVGVFLSGGYDSTAVTALLQSNRTDKLKTFTIGFEEGNNEAPYAKKIAQHIGTDHTEYYCTTKEALEIIPDLPFYYDEPFADSSAIPTILVSKLAVQKFTVALSADAGDEIFAGYSTYNSFINDLTRINKIPFIFQKHLVGLLNISKHLMPEQFHLKYKIDVLTKVMNIQKELMPQELYRNYPLVKLNSSLANRLFLNKPSKSITAYNGDYSGFHDDLSIALAIDYVMYLQNDILTKIDRATMSVSLEGREPFLDHRIIEYSAQLPNEFKFGQTQKMILKDIVHKYIPKELLDRPKAGFSIPIYNWIKGDLYPLLHDNLNRKAIEGTGLFNPDYVDKLMDRFIKGKLYDQVTIWKLIQFQMWYNKWM